MLLSKNIKIQDAIAKIPDGASIMVGGFGVPGTPFCLLEELRNQGQKNLTMIKNDANETGMGMDWLLEAGRVRKLITSHIGLNARAVEMMNSSALEVEFVPQGILAERIRCAGSGNFGFITDIGLGTQFEKGKTKIEIDGHEAIIEPALKADFALIHAHSADPFGNLRFAKSARNFNPAMAMAAQCVIVECEQITSTGAIAADGVHLSGVFTDHLVELDEITEVYGVVKR